MRRAGRMAGLLWVLAGCSSGLTGVDAAAGSAGASGSGGPGGGSGGSGASNNPNGLPACAISARPSDPKNPDGGQIDNASKTCNSIVTGAFVTDECFDMAGGGLVQDGGAGEVPAGGMIRDGDYDLVRYQGTISAGDGTCRPEPASTSRVIRIFGGGSYFEWAVTNRDASGAETYFWYDTTMSLSGHTLSFVSSDCGGLFGEQSYGYTASGDDFAYFNFTNGVDGQGNLTTVATYRRTCWR